METLPANCLKPDGTRWPHDLPYDSGPPMTANQRAGILRYAGQLNQPLSYDWEDMTQKEANFMLHGLRLQLQGLDTVRDVSFRG